MDVKVSVDLTTHIFVVVDWGHNQIMEAFSFLANML